MAQSSVSTRDSPESPSGRVELPIYGVDTEGGVLWKKGGEEKEEEEGWERENTTVLGS